ncbi:MAG: DEAD/DEAH box helicase family protein [Betaproteobacteria bacterium]|nr:DEAD/DEAH box helicase family protein [Betaproteobacteria bacterium]
MGEVLSFGAAARVKREDFRDFIDEAYDALAALPFFNERASQRDLSRQILEAYRAGVPLMAEAPTGTGKTLSYLVAALAAQQEQTKPTPVVIATATTLLQHQIIEEEIPKLVSAKLVDGSQVVVAKGRGRYFCAMSAERVAQTEERQDDLFEGSDKVEAPKAAEELLDLFITDKWAGDMDGAPIRMTPATRDAVKASGDSCVGWRCAYYARCPFYTERRRLQSAKVIVANQDLVLSDLRLAGESDGSAIFPVEKYLLVVDEAHRFPGKAQESGSASIDCDQAIGLIEELPSVINKLLRHPKVSRLLEKEASLFDSLNPGRASEALRRVQQLMRELSEEGSERQITLQEPDADARVAELEGEMEAALEECVRVAQGFSAAKTVLAEVKFPESDPVERKAFFDAWFVVSFNTTRMGWLRDALDAFIACRDGVRWIERRGDDSDELLLRASPMEGGRVLQRLLWGTERAKTVLVSATLSAFGSFARFAAKAGITERALTCVLPSCFNYESSTLVVKRLQHSPRQAERNEWEQELHAALPLSIHQEEATLVLFPSKRLLLQNAEVLRSRFGEAVLVQGTLPIATLTETHRARIDSGKASILCGVDSLAEGLDLPGKYCTHVVIVALPFTPPVTPVERRYQTLLRNRYFSERAMPDAMLKLKQMVGRLLRSERDQGHITVLDPRLASTRWGRQMLESLPPFALREEAVSRVS